MSKLKKIPTKKEIAKDTSSTNSNDKSTQSRKSTKLTKLSPKQLTCASIRSNREPHLKCLMKAKSENKYCPMHLLQNNIIDYSSSSFDEDILTRDEELMSQSKNDVVKNEIIKKINIDELVQKTMDKEELPAKKLPPQKKYPCKQPAKTIHEQKKSTIENDYRENEDDLEIKLLIIANDDKYVDTISKLIGPVFEDITISEDEQDPITYDKIWIMENGKKTPAAINKYYLFSYQDSNDKIRCMTIFTIKDMIDNNDFTHPLTMDKIPDKDIDRAKQLVDFYKTKIGLFKDNGMNQTPEYKLKNKITKLFKKFHIHSIYFEENWLMDLQDEQQLCKIITETEKIISANYKLINPSLTSLKLFQLKKKKSPSKKYGGDDEELLDLKEYIVEEWEKLIDASSGPENQLPIWILASGLGSIVPEIKEKYPNMELM